jgi:peptidoglycan/LPS O-acetylase OafA/YrhL
MAQTSAGARHARTRDHDRVRPNQPAPKARRFRPDIQGLRAIAVVSVALYHAGVPVLRGGYVGVDVFFVISGFLITRQLFDETVARGQVRLIGFYSKRFRRLLPPVVVVVGFTVVVAHFVLPHDQLKSLIKDVYFTSFYGINYHFASEGVQYQNAAAPPSALQHFWSLAVEEQFYVGWPILITVCALIGRRRFRRPLTVAVIVGLSAATLYYSIKISATNASVGYFSLQTRAWELGFGAIVALTADQWARLPALLARLMGWAGFTAILATAVLYSDRTVYPGVAAVVPVGGAALLIASGVLRNPGTPETALLERPWMQYGGKMSYAWYLWHWPMLILLPAWVGHSLNVWENVEIVCLAFWFAVLTYFLENAAHRSSWSVHKWASAGVMLSACVALLALVSGAFVPSLATTGTVRQAAALTGADTAAVQAALTTSITITKLPRNLTPTLAKAAKDVPLPTSCLASLTATTSPACVLGDPHATKTAVLLGDSHANQWRTPLSNLAKANHWRLIELAKAACPIADTVIWEADLKRNYTECDAFRASVKAQLASLRPGLIIASQSNAVPWTSVTDSQWAAKTVTALTGLASKKTRVVYIGDSPTTTADTLPCLQTHLADARKCGYLRQDAFGIFFNRYQVLGEKLLAAKIGYLDSLNYFCTPTRCPSVVQNMVVHRDTGHITDTYAKWLQPMLAPIFAVKK